MITVAICAVHAGALTPETRGKQPVSIGLLPVQVNSVNPSDLRMAGKVEAFEDAAALALPHVDIVERRHIHDVLTELESSKANSRDLAFGKIVGAEVLIVSAIRRENNQTVLDLSALETDSGRIVHHQSSVVPYPSAAELIVNDFFKGLPSQLVRRAFLADVAFLGITYESPFQMGTMTEALRRQLSKQLEAIEGIRVLDRQLASYILKEAQLAAEGYVDPYRKFMPIASAITIEGELKQEVNQGAPIDASGLTLELTVKKGAVIKRIKQTGTLAKVGELETAISKKLCKTVLAMADGTSDIKIELNDEDRRLWEAQRYLALAQAGVDPENSVIKAATLMPGSPEPYLVAFKLGLLDETKLLRAGANDKLAKFNQQFAERYITHKLWPQAVVTAQLCLLSHVPFYGYKYLQGEFDMSLRAYSNRDDFARARVLADLFLDAVTKRPEFFEGGKRESYYAIPSLRIFLVDGQYERAFQLCTAYEKIFKYSASFLLNNFVRYAIDDNQLDWAFKAITRFDQLGFSKTHPISNLDARGRLEKLKADSNPECWEPFLAASIQYDKKHENHYEPDLPEWGETSLVNRQETPSKIYKIKGDTTFCISSEGGELLALGAKVEPFRIWQVERGQWFWLDGFPKISFPDQIKRPVKHSLLAQFDGMFYISAGAHGFFSVHRPDPSQSPNPVKDKTKDQTTDFIPFHPATESEQEIQTGFQTNVTIAQPNTNRPSPAADTRVQVSDPHHASVTPVKGFPKGCVVDSLVVADSALYAAGRAAKAGFVARLEKGSTQWVFWTAPNWVYSAKLIEQLEDGRWLMAIDDGSWGNPISNRIAIFDPTDGTWNPQVYGPYKSPFLKMASIGTRALYIDLSGGGHQELYFCDRERQSIHPIHAPPSSLSFIYNRSFRRHEDLWRWNRQKDSDNSPYAKKYEKQFRWGQHKNCAMAPLAANFAVDVLAYDGLFWILDGNGGLTATADGRSFAGPFMVGDIIEGDAMWMCVAGGNIAVASHRGIHVVPLSFLKAKINEPEAWQQSDQIVATAKERIARWIQNATPEQQKKEASH